ncbi:MAG: hypothetical protein EAZ92_05460 [Candidatus Kapaibacterium sp.]|nr:MAG: hypothetical protein EAZ92_05460 [Candidatus Kapabacteria bacterium]
MGFSQFKSLGDVAKLFPFRLEKRDFITMQKFSPALLVVENIRLVLETDLHRSSEAARCETLIFPILQEVWRHYADVLKLWNHAPLQVDDLLGGVPDYLVAKKSEFGPMMMGMPIVVAIEAKQDDFVAGWGQCVAEMFAAQKYNASEAAVYGIVSNGETWEFSKLEGSVLTQNVLPFGIADLDKLFGALAFVMEECKKQVELISS